MSLLTRDAEGSNGKSCSYILRSRKSRADLGVSGVGVNYMNKHSSVLLAFDKEQSFLAFGLVCVSVCKKYK